MSLQPWVNLTIAPYNTPLPQNISIASAVVSAGAYIYLMGGFNGSILNTVYSAKMNTDGTLDGAHAVGGWLNLTTTPLPQTINYASAVVSADGYIYLMGGG